jgi:hypothetical protein
MEKEPIIDDRVPAIGNAQSNCAMRYISVMNIALLILIFFIGCERQVIVPQHLAGIWKTAAPNYADRYLKLSEQAVIFGIGEGQEVAHKIDKIKSEQRDSGTVYTFYYRDAEGQKDSLTVTYLPDSGGTLQIKNSVEIWVKSATGQTE